MAFARMMGLDETLKEQGGVIRRDQAIVAGVRPTRIDDLIRRGRWLRVLPRVYGVAVDPSDPVSRIRACWLWAGDRSTVAEQAAAWWLGLSRTPPTVITVIVPLHTRRSAQLGVRIVRAEVRACDVEFENWIRVTSAARTGLDLARRGLRDELETVLRVRRMDPGRLNQSLTLGRGRRGQLRARKAVDEVATNPWSAAERLAHRHLRDAGITGWTANPPIRLRCGVRYPDIAFEDIKLAVEIDGREHHSGRRDFEMSRMRHNQFVEAGWTILQFTWKDVTENPGAMVAIIRSTADRLRAISG